jgi:hypothetical protein
MNLLERYKELKASNFSNASPVYYDDVESFLKVLNYHINNAEEYKDSVWIEKNELLASLKHLTAFMLTAMLDSNRLVAHRMFYLANKMDAIIKEIKQMLVLYSGKPLLDAFITDYIERRSIKVKEPA